MPVAEHTLHDGRTLACEAPTIEMAQESLRFVVEQEEMKLRWGTDNSTLAMMADIWGSLEAAKAELARIGCDLP